MKKRFLVLLSAIFICVSLSACGNSAQQLETTTVVDNTKGTVITEEKNARNTVPITTNETVTMVNESEEIELTVKEISYESEIDSKSDNMFKEYFKDVDNETYLVLKTDIKNIGGNSVNYRFFDSTSVVYEDKYNYKLQPADIESTVLSSYWSVDPLKTTEVYFFQSVPDELKGKAFKATFSAGQNDYVLIGN